jgi:ribosomal-protein-alanine acetyltransferase
MNRFQLDEVMVVERLAYPIPWTRSMFETSLASSDECWVLMIDGEIAGYAIVSYILDEAHLLNICIHPNYFRQGLGRKLLQYLIARALDKRKNVFFLEVRISNQSAIDLYFSEGFNEVGVRPNYYPAKSGKEDAVLMTLELSVDERV